MCTQVLIFLSMHMGGPWRTTLGVFPQVPDEFYIHFYPYSLRWDLLLVWNSPNMLGWGPVSLWELLVSAYSALGLQTYTTTPISVVTYLGAWGQTLLFMLVRQVFYGLSHHAQPSHWLLA